MTLTARDGIVDTALVFKTGVLNLHTHTLRLQTDTTHMVSFPLQPYSICVSLSCSVIFAAFLLMLPTVAWQAGIT